MKCSNCGAELKEGTLVCPRCGARQNNPARPKGSGSGGTGGFKVGKILAAVLSVVLVISASVLIVRHFSADKKSDSFTHNIDFYKDNLTVQDESTLRYREVPETQTFSVGSGKGFVNVDIVDEMGDKVNFVVDKTVKDDRYIIKPSNVWDSRHVYYLTLGEDTYFTDEAMFQFNKLVYSIKREDVAEFKYKDNIINIVENPNQVVKEGDLVITKDENGQQICKKVKATVNGQHVYETPDLTEVFEELNIHGTINPDLNEIFNDPSVRKQLLHNISQHPIFDYFVMTTYAASNDSSYKLAETEIKGALIKQSKDNTLLDNLDIDVSFKKGDKLTALGEWKLKFQLEKPEKYTKGVGISVSITRKGEFSETKDSGGQDSAPIEKFDAEKSNGQSIKLTFEFDSPTIIPDVDIKNKKFDFVYSVAMNMTVDYSIDFYNAKFELEEEARRLKGGEYIKLVSTPINSGVPCVFFFLELGFEPEINANVKLGGSYSKTVLVSSGITYDHHQGAFKKQELCSSDDDGSRDKLKLSLKGKFESEFPLKASFGVKIALVPDGEIKAFKKTPFLKWINDLKEKAAKLTEVGKLDLYLKVGLSFEIEGELQGEWEFEDGDTRAEHAGLNFSLDLSIILKAGAEGELKMPFAEIKAGADLRFLDIKRPLISVNKEIPIASQSYPKRPVIIDVSDEGSYMYFGKYEYLVLRKDSSSGKALLISKEGVSTEVYRKEGNSLDWAKSSLREYLNGKFFDADGGFGNSEKESIFRTVIKPDYNENESEAATVDKIFILSKAQLELFLSKNESRELKASSRAISEGAYVCPEDGENKKKGNTIYWVRTQGKKPTSIMVVRSNGSIAEEGVNVNGPDNIDGVKAKVCVRPALWINYLGENVSEKFDSIKDGFYGFPTGQYDNHLYQ